MKTENSEELEREMKEKNIVDTIPMGSGAAEPEVQPEVDLLRSAIIKH